LAAKSRNPSYLVIHPNHRYLYAVNEINHYDGQDSGGVSAYSIDGKTGMLTLLNEVASGDKGPCNINIDRTGKYVLVANYEVGSVAVFPILPDGQLGKATAYVPHHGHSIGPRQQVAHAHCVNLSPDNRFDLSADLGADQVYVYRFDATKGTLTPNDPPSVAVPPGSGPRHLAINPNGKIVYVLGEIGSNLTTFSYDGVRGVLHPLETISTLPTDFKGSTRTAEIEILPNGKFLYASNRGHDSITVFSIDPATSMPKPVEYISTQGKIPRGFGIDPTGRYLLAGNKDSDTLVVFRIDANTGRLTPTGQIEEISSPVCVVYEPVE
jgi:6-phosphogluconolactonase